MTFHCFFEQSGTFKNEFRKLGYEAYDYDILNDFGETDYLVDLFHDIETAYERERERTVFDNVQKGDQIIAFFPCTRFEDQIVLGFTGNSYGQKDWDDKRKLEYDLKLHNELHELYCLITKLVLVCISRSIPLIIENPKGTMHYLTRYWCLNPSVIDNNRKERGDLFKKPTQYWFINRKPSNHLIIEPIKMNESCSLEFITKADWQYNDKIKNRKVARSMIHPDYANRFIREFII